MIKLLGKTVSDKISAGEVIERPLSVVKELVENSIDAGATELVVEIRKGGTEYIRVTDNGSGIPSDEAELAFLRHATSKIEKAEDLDELITLGFRGEALPSIAAVSRTEMLTKTQDNKTGIKLCIEGGQVTENSPAGCPDGTTIIVRDLFYNTPARRKFMGSKAAETGAVTDLMTNIALAYPDIKVRMISNENILFSTRGTGNRLDVIITTSGRHISDRLLTVSMEDEGWKVSGYVSGPGESRSSRKNQVFFVNGRVIRSKVMEKGLDMAYRERLFEGRHPIAYLFMEVDPGDLDVNIHPTKQEIRFDDDEKAADFIRRAVSATLMSAESVPDIHLRRDNVAHIEKKTHNIESTDQSDTNMTSKDPETDIKTNRQDPETETTNVKTGFTGSEPEKTVQVDIKNILSTIREEESRVSEHQTEYNAETIVRNKAGEIPFNDLELKGTIFGTYILAVFEDTFYMIDQHAAHERIFYEQLNSRMAASEKFSQQVMIPITFTCNREEEDWIEPLSGFGFEIENFGPSTYIARGIPDFFDLTQSEEFIHDYIDTLDETGNFQSSAIKDRLALRACKSAVKANDHLKEAEIKQLISDLSKCQNPYSCPHGRPTFIKLTRYDIEKRFKRV